MDSCHGVGPVPSLVIALAHAGKPIQPHDLWGAWTFEPVTTVTLMASGWLYAVGLRRLWRAAGTGRGVRSSGVTRPAGSVASPAPAAPAL